MASNDYDNNHNGNDHEEGEVQIGNTDRLIRRKIMYVLANWPYISASMLQSGIGPSISSAMWRPILAQLKREGIVIERDYTGTSPTGRSQAYTIIQLASTPEYVRRPYPEG